MASIQILNGKNGKPVSCRFRCVVGREDSGRQIFRTTTVPYPDTLTPAKAKKQLMIQADIWENAEKERYNSGTAVGNVGIKESMSFKQFAEEYWMTDFVRDGMHTPATTAYYEFTLRIVLAYFGSTIKLDELRPEHVKRFIKYLKTTARSEDGTPYSATTVRAAFNTLRTILEYAVRMEYLQANPCRVLTQQEKPQSDKKAIDFLKPGDARRFLECLSAEPLFWHCLEFCIITTGVRRGECVGLQWGDFDERSLILNVHRNVTIDKNSPDKYRIGPTKTKESRMVPVGARLAELLAAHKCEQESRFGSLRKDAFIFSRKDDPYVPLYPTAPTQWQSRFIRRHGLPNVSPHDLRHTAATLALESGANLKQVQTLLGHRDPSTTLAFYSGVTEEAQRRTVDGIERLLMSEEKKDEC